MLPRQRLVLILLVIITTVALALLGSLLAQPAAASPEDISLGPNLFLSTVNIQWLSLGALIPLAVALSFVWQHERPVAEFLQPELLGAFGVWVAFANGYAVAYMLALVGVLPTLTPPVTSLTDSRLTQIPVNIIAILIIVATLAFYSWFLFFRRRGFGAIADRIHLPHRRAALLLLLSVLAVIVWLFGGVSFALLMIPPTWLWLFIEPSASLNRKILNTLLALAGIGPFSTLLWQLPAGFNLWQFLLTAIYGVIWPIDVLMFLLLVALFLRFLRLGLSTPYILPPTPPDEHEILSKLIQ